MKLLLALALGSGFPLWAETPAPAAASKGSDNISKFDDGVFNLNGNSDPDTRTSAGGTTRYLDKAKDFDYNSETRATALKGCDSLRESSNAAWRECVAARLKSGSSNPDSRKLDSVIRKKSPAVEDRPSPATGEEDLGIGED